MRAVNAAEYDGKIAANAGCTARKFDKDQACDKRR
jgi:hypothetical protein